VSLFDCQDNAFKLSIHGAALVLNAEMAAYNLLVYRKRRGAWHLLSAAVYASFVVLEVIQISRHVGEP
jgi:hypothetical protein